MMKSALSLTLLASLVGSALPATAQEKTATTAGPLARAIARRAIELAEAAAPIPSESLQQQSAPPADVDIWEMIQALRPQTRVRLLLTNGSTIPGRVVEARPDALVLDDVQTGPTGVARPASATSAKGLAFLRTEISNATVLQ